MKLSLENKLIIAGLLVFFSVGVFFSDSYLPSLPSITESLGATHQAVKLTISFYLLGLGLAPLVFGPLSDHYGRKKILLSGLIIAFLGSLLCVLAPNIHVLIVGRFIQGSGAAAASSLGRIIMSDIFKGKTLAKVGSLMGMLIGIVPAMAPVLGGYVQHIFNWRGNFALMLVITFVAILYLLLFIPETNKALTPGRIRFLQLNKNYWELLKNRKFMTNAMSATLAFGGVIVYLTISPFIFQNVIGLTPIQYGWLAFVIGAAIILGAFNNSWLLKFFESQQLILAAAFVMLSASALLLLLGLLGHTTVTAIMLPIFFYAISTQMVFGNSFSLAMHATSPGRLGYAGALYATVMMAGSAVISALAALVHVRNQVPLGALLVCTSFLFLANAYFGVCSRNKEN
jgi:Bcr/CflA subfamily drug resistance transporter